MSKTHEQVVAELDAKIPRDAIESRDGGGGRKLSYLSGWYVIDRLNKVLGIGNWAYTSDADLLHTDTTNMTVHYKAKVRLAVKFPNGETTEFSDYGYGDGSDKYKIGKAHELAIKEAVTDGIKRCAKNLGMSLGLALYDKSQENVEDEAPKAVAKAAPRAAPQTVAPANDREALNKKITAMSKVVIAKRLRTLDELKAAMKSEYGVDSTAALTDTQATQLFTNLEALANG
jgi:recombination DNA repair RAD52 pathway protein